MPSLLFCRFFSFSPLLLCVSLPTCSCAPYPCCASTTSSLALSCLVLSCLVLSYLLLPSPVLACLVLSRLVSSCLVLSCLVLSCLVLSCLVLSCVVLSCLVLSCLLLLPSSHFFELVDAQEEAGNRVDDSNSCLFLCVHKFKEVRIW